MSRVVYVALVVALGCQRSKDPPKPPPASLDLVLEKPGIAPRPVRYHVTKGTVTPFEIAIDMSVSVGGHGTALPTFDVALELAADDVEPGGATRVRTKIVDAKVVRDNAGSGDDVALRDMLAQLNGVTIAAALSPDGKLRDVHVEPGPKQLSPAVAQQLQPLEHSYEQIAIALPTDPIGVGARWRTTRTVKDNGMTMTTTSFYDVTSLDGDRLGFAMTSDAVGVEQDVDIDGMRVHVANLHGHGEGKGTIDLARMVMAGELATDLHAEMEAQGKREPLDMKLKQTVSPR